MEILYSDRDILVALKPAFISSETPPQGAGMPELLREECGCDIFPVHRLDLPARGLMVFAKNTRAAAFLSKEIAEKRFSKEYLAAVYGAPEERGVFEDLLFRDSKKNKSYVVKRERCGVKKAALEYELLKSTKQGQKTLSLVRVRLITGRTHQIRVQFASRKMPLMGDGKYGAADNLPLHLQSVRLGFRHPASGERLLFEAPTDGELFGKFL